MQVAIFCSFAGILHAHVTHTHRHRHSGDLKFQEIVVNFKFQDKISFQEIYLWVVETADTGGAKPICIHFVFA